jgi:uncharacterized membrane protein YgcG
MVRRGLAMLAVVACSGLVAAAPAAALVGTGEEHITSYDVVLTVNDDGTLAVRETIDYDFAFALFKHGIFRTIPVRVPYDKDNDRLYEVDDFRVESPTGAPTTVDRSDAGGIATFRIGDRDQTVKGEQRYVVTYTVDGALNAFPDHVELYWNAIGDGWDVPITTASVRVVTPVAATQQLCFAGPTGSSLPCGSIEASGIEVTATQPQGLEAHSAFTVVVGLPSGAVTATGPRLEERWTLRRSLTPTPLTGTLAGLLLLPGLAGIAWLVGVRGRDRRYAGQTPGVVPASGGEEERVPLVGAGAVAVQFQPPEGLRPGQLGTLLDERANVLDVTATIVDLAVRGHLRIVELERAHWFSSRDWQLEELEGVQGELRPYETLLYNGLFRSRQTVKLSSLKKTFAARMASVQTALYDDVTKNGWFHGRPDKVRGRWQSGGFVLAIAGGWLTWLLGRHVHWAPVGIAVTVLGVALFLLGRRMPARTAAGTAVLAQAKGFREYIRTAEAEQLRFEEGQDIFSRYLPYAVVFGETDHWVKVFGPLAAASSVGSSTSWYSGPAGWNFSHFGDSMEGFTSTAASTMASSTSSSSGGSGFSGGGSSGGGGGGGGGGSW